MSSKKNVYANNPALNQLCKAVVVILMGFVILISFTPLVWVFISSFKTNLEVLDSAFSWPATFSFQAYTEALDLAKIPVCLGNSLLIASSATLIALLIYSMAAYVIARFEFRGKTLISLLLISAMLIPGNSMIQSIYTLSSTLGLYDTKLVLILVYTGFGMALSIFILRSSFSELPKELEEAAYIEGCSYIRTYFKIMLPMAKPALASAGTLLFINNWNEFLYALMLTSSSANRTIPVALRAFKSFFTYNYPAMFAAIMMTVLPCIAIYVLLQEQVMESMVVGAVKG